MTKKLWIEAISKFLAGVLLVGVLLFWPAGTWDYWNAWLLMGLLFIPMLTVGVILMFRHPTLLQKRLNVKEQEKEQRTVILLSGLLFTAAFIVAGLNVRFGWLILPPWVAVIGSVLFLTAYGLYAEVLRENAYLSRTVEVQDGQKVIDTGLYGIVRHPMYAATVVLFFSMGLVLGSLFSAVLLLLYIPIIVKRIQNEEKVLEQGLPGYSDYQKKVKYRLIPPIW